LQRAEKAEADQKALKEQLAKEEAKVLSLNNKVTLLTQDLERSEKRADEVGTSAYR
jgi:tropomyosin